MASAEQLLIWAKEVLDNKGYNYGVEDDEPTILSGMSLDNKLNSTNIRIFCRDGHIAIYAFVKIYADEGCRSNVAEYITRANYGLTFGNFEMDLSDGEVRYKMVLDADTMESLPESVFMRAFYIPIHMLEKYGDGLLAVMFGMKSPEEAIDEAEAE